MHEILSACIVHNIIYTNFSLSIRISNNSTNLPMNLIWFLFKYLSHTYKRRVARAGTLFKGGVGGGVVLCIRRVDNMCYNFPRKFDTSGCQINYYQHSLTYNSFRTFPRKVSKTNGPLVMWSIATQLRQLFTNHISSITNSERTKSSPQYRLL